MERIDSKGSGVPDRDAVARPRAVPKEERGVAAALSKELVVVEVRRGATASAAAAVVGDLREEDGQEVVPEVAAGAVVVDGADSGGC